MVLRDRAHQDAESCEHCGHALADDFAFCPGCGAPRPVTVAPSEPDDTTSILGFQPDSPDGPAPAVTRTRRRRVLTASAIGVALVVVIALAGMWGWNRYQDNQVVAVFRPADTSFAKALTAMTQASTRDQLADAATMLSDTEPSLTKARDKAATRDSDIAQQAEGVLDSEIAFAAAASPLSDPSTDLASWGETRSALADALVGLQHVEVQRDDLMGGSDALATDAVETTVDKVVVAQAAATATDSLNGMFSDIHAAGTTADLREVGSQALENVAGLRTMAGGFEQGSVQATQLGALADLYDCLGALTALDGDHLDQWAKVRSDVLRSAAALAGVEPTRRGAIRAAQAIDTLVHNAQLSLRDWRVRYNEATTQRTNALKVATSYRAAMDRLLDRYAGLRADLSNWIDRVEDPSTYVTWDEAYRVLSNAQWDRQAVRDEMSGLTVPPSLSTEHNEVLTVIDDAIEAVAAAYEGLSDAQSCVTSCYYANTPGWRRFQSESDRITTAYESATNAWSQAIQSELARIEGMRPPDRPEV